MKPQNPRSEILARPRPFWLNVILLVAGTGLFGWILSLVGFASLSNVYFIAAAVFLVISAVPIFSEMGSNAKTSVQARKEGKQLREIIKEQDEAGKFSQGTRITFLFGISGFICFILAFFTI